MKHKLIWFKNRIGKKIFRARTTCKCDTCTRVWKEGLLVHDLDHARYIEMVQHDLDIDYFDKPLIPN